MALIATLAATAFAASPTVATAGAAAAQTAWEATPGPPKARTAGSTCSQEPSYACA